MIARQTKKFPGTVMRLRKTEKVAVKYDRPVGGRTLAQRFGTEKVIPAVLVVLFTEISVVFYFNFSRASFVRCQSLFYPPFLEFCFTKLLCWRLIIQFQCHRMGTVSTCIDSVKIRLARDLQTGPDSSNNCSSAGITQVVQPTTCWFREVPCLMNLMYGDSCNFVASQMLLWTVLLTQAIFFSSMFGKSPMPCHL